MKNKFVVYLFSLMFCAASVHAQNILDEEVDLETEGISADNCLRMLQDQLGCNFSYNSTLLDKINVPLMHAKNQPLRAVLAELMGDHLLRIEAKGDHILLILAAAKVTGRVVDKDDEPVAYANVILEETNTGMSTLENGAFSLKVSEQGVYTLKVSAIGYKSFEKKINVKVGEQQFSTIRLRDDLLEMQAVVVNGARHRSISATKSVTPIKDLPVPAMIIEGRQLEMMGSRRLNEVLQEQTGLALTTDPSGASAAMGLQVQGFDAAYTMIMIDGQPLIGRNSVGILDLSRISVANIERIEIIKGSSSALYGSDALSGIVNIVTKNVKVNGTTAMAAMRYGSFGTTDATFNGRTYSLKNDLSAGISANFYRTDGFDSDATTPGKTMPPYFSYSFQGKLDSKLTANQLLKTTIRLSQKNQTNEYDLKGYGLRKEENVENDFTANFVLQSVLSEKSNVQTQYYYTHYSAENLAGYEGIDSSFSEKRFDQNFHRVESYLSLEHKEFSFITGVGANLDMLDATRYGNARQMTNAYAYLQTEYKPSKKVGWLGGIRYDLHSIYGHQLSPRLGLRYHVTKRLTFKGTVGTGFKAPSFQQLYLSFTNPSAGYTVLGAAVFEDEIAQMERDGEIAELYGNAEQIGDLQAEHSFSTNVGGSLSLFKSLSVSFNGFHNEIRNMIFEELVGVKQNGSQIYSYRNIERAFTQGLELNAEWKAMPNLTLSSGYQLLFAKDRSVIDAIKNEEVQMRTPRGEILVAEPSDYFNLSNRSRHMANFKVYYQYLPWHTSAMLRLNMRGKYGVGDRNYPNEFIDPYDLYAEAYWLVNVTLEKQLADGKWNIKCSINNLTDYSSNLIPTLAGRQWLIAVAWNFNKENND